MGIAKCLVHLQMKLDYLYTQTSFFNIYIFNMIYIYI